MFASISDQLINTAIILDMMFNTEMIVKDMKGGKEDMTEKRFKLRFSKLGNGMITDTQKRKHLYFDKKFLDTTLPKTYELLNELADENEQLKQRNNRQYEQLGRLYDLIEQKEWRVLTDIIDDFKKSDEQLQKEWGTYGDVE